MSVINCDLRWSGQEAFSEPKGCIATYKNEAGNGGFQYPQSGNLIAPWVAIEFLDGSFSRGNGAAITVSNLSSTSTTPANCAIISSFTFGHSDGCMARFTIHDTNGGNFEEFMKHLLMDWENAESLSNATYIKVQFGWVKSGCKEPLPASRSPCYYLFIQSIETNFTEGKFIFEITATDIGTLMPEGSVKLEIGGIGKEGVHLIEAMRTLLCDPATCKPLVKQFRFKLADNSYTFNASNNLNPNQDFLFNNKTSDAERRFGRLDQYQAHGKNKLEICKKWLSSQPSVNDKAWIISFNPEEEEFLIQEEAVGPLKECKPDPYFDSASVGTYIVNGGPLSPVLEFNPKIKWNWAAATGGPAGQLGDKQVNPLNTNGGENPGGSAVPREAVCGAGMITGTSTEDGKQDQGNDAVKEDATKEADRSATSSYFGYQPITTDLVIVGDPTFCPPQLVKAKFCGIVFLNPFFLEKRNNSGPCGDWYLAEPACNEVLSNKGWLVEGVTHQISSGKYTTTINLSLAAPGINIAPKLPLGGWCEGWKPDQAI